MTRPLIAFSLAAPSLAAPSLAALSLAALLGCQSVTTPTPTRPAAPTFSASGNPLLDPWSGAFGGVPPLDKVKVADFKPALEKSMAENLAEIEAIANDKAAPNFENTIAAFEKSGRTFGRVQTVFGIFRDTLSTPEFQKVENEWAPKISEFGDKIVQNEKLFARIAAVYETREKSKLTPEQQRLVWLDYSNFVHAGAKLDAAAKARMMEINGKLASLFATFNQDVMADEAGYPLFLEKESDLAGLPDSVKASAAAAADALGKKGQWAIVNTRSSMEPFLTYSDRRELREKVWRTFYSRGNNGDAHDTKAIITQILELRAERAQLLGFASHSHWRLDQSMAKTPEATLKLMESVWKPAVARVHEEVADMQALADKESAGITIEGWDYRYYAEKVRKAKYDLDQNAMTPYLQLDKMRDALFYTAKRLFGLEFKPLTGIPLLVPEEQVYEVTDAAGKHVGLWYFDPYARTGKRSGAWMNAYRNQERFDQPISTIVSNNTNFVKGAAGEPVLISWDDATTMFHEFGHALHGLLSNVDYPSLSGTSVFSDYVEFPSQLLEHWVETPEVLNQFALNVKTGAPMPKELVEKIEKASKFNQGFATVEYLSAALVDMKLHLAATPKKPIDPAAFERDTLAALGMPKEIVMRHRTTQFLHLFSNDDYAAGYYSYLWSDTLAADAWEAFVEAKSPWDPATAKKLKEHVFSVGNTVDPAEGYRAFRGRDPGTAALMRKRGFPVQ
jgi:peptidyl-dipeptidase Dcp